MDNNKTRAALQLILGALLLRYEIAIAFKKAFQDELNGSTPPDWRLVLPILPLNGKIK